MLPGPPPGFDAPKAPSSGFLSDLFGGLGGNFIQMFGLTSVLAAAGMGGHNSYLGDGWKLLLLGTLIEAGRRAFSYVMERFRFRYSMTARFSEGDPAYEWIILFLTEKNVWRRSRDFWVNSKTSARKWGITPGIDKADQAAPTEVEEPTDYVPIYEIPQLFNWKGYWLEIHREQGAPQYHGRTNTVGAGAAVLHLTIYSLDMSVLKSLVDEARQRYVEVSKPNVIIHSSDSRNGGPAFTWNKVKSKVRRPLSSIILPKGELESLVEDAQEFVASEDWYTEAGIPYRRGYLLYGPPGTGKSSTIYALAGELGLEIYTISLSADYIDDTTLQAAVASIPKRSILLIEDIDCAFPSREDEEENQFDLMRINPYLSPSQIVPPRRSAVTMSGLLNIIDGVDSEEGKFFMATTNYVDRLDAALLRPGRIDRKVQYSLATAQQTSALFARFYPESRFGKDSPNAPNPPLDLNALTEEFTSGIPPEDFSIAELQGYLLSCKQRPLEAVQGVRAWVEKEQEERRAKAQREEERKQKLKAAKEKQSAGNGMGISAFGAPSPYTPYPRVPLPVTPQGDASVPSVQILQAPTENPSQDGESALKNMGIALPDLPSPRESQRAIVNPSPSSGSTEVDA